MIKDTVTSSRKHFFIWVKKALWDFRCINQTLIITVFCVCFSFTKTTLYSARRETKPLGYTWDFTQGRQTQSGPS